VLRAPKPRLLIGLSTAQGFVRGCLNVLIVVTVFRVLHVAAGAVGYMTAALGLGGLVGAFASFGLVRHRLAVPFGIALVFWGVPIVLLAPSRYLVLALFLLALVGAANSIEDVALFTLLQRIVSDDVLTRVLAVLWAAGMGAVALGSVVAPLIVHVAGPRAALLLVGAILPLLTLVNWRKLLEIDRTVAAPTHGLALPRRRADVRAACDRSEGAHGVCARVRARGRGRDGDPQWRARRPLLHRRGRTTRGDREQRTDDLRRARLLR
jgi:MFS family permease